MQAKKYAGVFSILFLVLMVVWLSFSAMYDSGSYQGGIYRDGYISYSMFETISVLLAIVFLISTVACFIISLRKFYFKESRKYAFFLPAVPLVFSALNLGLFNVLGLGNMNNWGILELIGVTMSGAAFILSSVINGIMYYFFE